MQTHSDKNIRDESKAAANNLDKKTPVGERRTLDSPGAVMQNKLQELANNSTQVKQLRSFQQMINTHPNTGAMQLQAGAHRNAPLVSSNMPVQLQDDYKFDPADEKVIMEVINDNGLQGMCSAWTIDWITRTIAQEGVFPDKPSRAELSALAQKQKEYMAARNLEAYGAGKGNFTLAEIGRGTISTANGFERIAALDSSLIDNTGYYLQLTTGGTEGHAIAIYKSEHDITVMDQNIGQFTINSLANLNVDSRYPAEIQRFAKSGTHLNQWYLNRLTPKPVAANGCCFITTACVRSQGLGDDCEELLVLRRYRDQYIRNLNNGEEMIMFYYTYSPRIVTALDKLDNAKEVYNGLYKIIRTCVFHIRRRDDELAFRIYLEMCLMLQQKFVPEEMQGDLSEYIPLN